RLDRRSAEIDQRDVVAIERGVIVGVDAEPLGAERIALRRQGIGDGRVADDILALGAEELGGGVVGVLARQQIGERRRGGGAAAVPALVVFALPLLGAHGQ